MDFGDPVLEAVALDVFSLLAVLECAFERYELEISGEL